MENKGPVDVKAKQDYFEKRRRHQLNNFKSKQQEITLVELSASDVEILDEGSLSGEDIKIEKVCKEEEAKKRGRESVVRRKRTFGGSNYQETLSRPRSSLVRKGKAGHRRDFERSNLKEKLPGHRHLKGDEGDRRRNGAQVDFEKMRKSRRKESLDSEELGSNLVNRCSVREKLVAPSESKGAKVSLFDSLKRKKDEVKVEAEDSGYISKVDGSEEDGKQSEEVVVMVDLCCSSKSISEASASSNTDDSSVEMVGEVQVALETSPLDGQASTWDEEEHIQEENFPRSKRPRLELHANKMQWYLETLNIPECHEVDIDLRREAEEVEAAISQNL